MTGVNQLGYLIFGVSDLSAWRGLASSVLGMELVPGDTRSTTYLRMDEHSHRIELRNDGRDDLEVIGWEVPDAAALHAVAQRLEDVGVKVKSGTRDEADQRRVVELIQFDDPAGLRGVLRTASQPAAVSPTAGDHRIQDGHHGTRAPRRLPARSRRQRKVLHGTARLSRL